MKQSKRRRKKNTRNIYQGPHKQEFYFNCSETQKSNVQESEKEKTMKYKLIDVDGKFFEKWMQFYSLPRALANIKWVFRKRFPFKTDVNLL